MDDLQSEEIERALTKILENVDFSKYNTEVQKGAIEKYIDDPFFSNNIVLIEKFNTLYKETKNKNVLDLMHLKQISQLHYSYYRNFAEYFISMGEYDAANYILKKGIKKNCYQKKNLVEVLKELPPAENTDLKSAFKVDSIFLFGREWAQKDENFFLNSILFLNNEPYGFLERKAYDLFNK